MSPTPCAKWQKMSGSGVSAVGDISLKYFLACSMAHSLYFF